MMNVNILQMIFQIKISSEMQEGAKMELEELVKLQEISGIRTISRKRLE